MSPQVQTSDQQYPPMAVAATPFASGPPLEDAALETQGPQWHQYGENVSAQGPLDFTRLLEKEDERDYDYQPSPDSADYQPTPSFSQGVMTGQGSDAFGSRPPF